MSSDSYRRCAFINATAELGATLPEATIVRKHKADMAAAIATLLPPGPGRKAAAKAIALAVDGAIVHAQVDVPPDARPAFARRTLATNPRGPNGIRNRPDSARTRTAVVRL